MALLCMGCGGTSSVIPDAADGSEPAPSVQIDLSYSVRVDEGVNESDASFVKPKDAGDSTTPAKGSSAALLSYIDTLAGQSRHILIGQHSDYYIKGNVLDQITSVTASTKKTPAILGTTLGMQYSYETAPQDGGPPLYQPGLVQDGVTISNNWLAQGGVVLLSLWPGNPAAGAPWNGNPQDLSINFTDVVTPGTTAYKNWYAYLDVLAAHLTQIKGAVLFRPFIEVNGSWFWFGNRDGATFIKLWQAMHDYLVNTKHVGNLVWVYNVNTGWGNYTTYYPGSSYVDVVSMDSYPPTSGDAPMYEALLTLDKPLMYAETGLSPNIISAFSGDNSAILATVKASYPKVFGLVYFCTNQGLAEQNGLSEIMNDPVIVTRSDLATDL